MLSCSAGHNFGFFHSGKGTDNYGDHSCAMGSYQAMRGYNGPVCWSAGLAGMVGGGDLTSTSQMPAGETSLLYRGMHTLSGSVCNCCKTQL
jgi:hypothetical protein